MILVRAEKIINSVYVIRSKLMLHNVGEVVSFLTGDHQTYAVSSAWSKRSSYFQTKKMYF